MIAISTGFDHLYFSLALDTLELFQLALSVALALATSRTACVH
jgi:hypothetical protein